MKKCQHKWKFIRRDLEREENSSLSSPLKVYWFYEFYCEKCLEIKVIHENKIKLKIKPHKRFVNKVKL